MQTIRYIEGVSTLKLDIDRCTGCGVCTTVCPHAVFEIAERRARIIDLDACMECGACATNCAWNAISLTPGVGCAQAIIYGWLHNTEPSCGGPNGCCGPDTAETPAPSVTATSCGCDEPAEEPSSCCSTSSSRPEAPS